MCKQIESDNQLYNRRLEAEKKIQVDLEQELQYSFNEIAKLNSLLDGKVPKGILKFQTTSLQIFLLKCT